MVDSIYHVGDEVVVLPDLVSGDGNYVFEGTNVSLYVNQDMLRHRGRKAKITKVSGTRQRIHYQLDISGWAWTADMFEDNAPLSDIKLDFDLLGGCCS